MFAVMRKALVGLGAVMVSIAAVPSAAQAAFPDQPVHIVVPFAPGGGTDLITRALSGGMANALGQPVVIDNRPGAGTIIGANEVARSKPDGYTLVMHTFAFVVNPSLHKQLPYSTEKGFAPISLIARGPTVLVVPANSPFKSVKDVVDTARAHPGTVTFATQGIGTSADMAGELLQNLAKVSLVQVPFKGAGPALTDLLGGHVQIMFGTAAAVSDLVKSGKLRALAVTSPEPSTAFPGVPTVAQTVPGYSIEAWYGLFAAAGTPPDVVARLRAAAVKATQTPEFAEKIKHEGLTVTASTPQVLQDFVQAEQTRWHKVIVENHIETN